MTGRRPQPCTPLHAYPESFNSRLRDEFLEMNYFHTLAEAQELARRWNKKYNTQWKHARIGYASGPHKANRPEPTP